GSLGGYPTQIYDINDSGQIVGAGTLVQGTGRAFLYSSGVMTDLGTFGGATSAASGINASGQVVGTASTLTGETHAFVYSPATGMTDLQPLLAGAPPSYATSINDSGQIVGQFTASNGYLHAFLLNGSAVTDLGALINGGLANSNPVRINNSGRVLISSDVGAYLYSGGIMAPVSGLPNRVTGMNNSGQIVSEGGSCCTGLLYRNGQVTDLSSLGLGISILVAQDINDSGQIAV